jgi:hypothetical protein
MLRVTSQTNLLQDAVAADKILGYVTSRYLTKLHPMNS